MLLGNEERSSRQADANGPERGKADCTEWCFSPYAHDQGSFYEKLIICVGKTLRNTHKRSGTILKRRHRAVLHTDVSETTVLSVSGSKYSVKFIAEAFQHVIPFQTKIKRDPAKL